ncbi:hypothetical protein, partial [Celeribacter halophilus]|uniref:hypothetical protein n=1 Tax=Celeribacter halophilus TaxID=576117 RepID=UPI003A8F7162
AADPWSKTKNGQHDKLSSGNYLEKHRGLGTLTPAIVRRISVQPVDPDTFKVSDLEAWIAAEIAANSGRWT